MTILHIYDENDAMAGRYVEMLMQASQALVSEGSLFDEPCVMYACTNAKDCRQLTDEHHPDILHLHGASAPFTLPAGLRLVVTPHGDVLGPVHAYVVVARSPHEAEALQQKFPRIETVRNPLITRTITAEECARQMIAIYQRVMNSNVLPLMDTETHRLLTAALVVATYGDTRWLPSTYHFSAENVNFRHLYLYATNEGVLPLVQQGLTMLGIAYPQPLPKGGECLTPSLRTTGFPPLEGQGDAYLPVDFHQPQPMPVATAAELLAHIADEGPSLLRLSELARVLHGDNIDEERLLMQVEEAGRMPLLAAVLSLMAEHLLLTEGFMPCPPAEGPATQQLRTLLAKRQEL